MLSRYARGGLTEARLAEWLVQAEYDTDLPDSERDALAALRLTVIEVAETMGPNEEIHEKVNQLLKT
jgi:hypothetical protein